MEFRHSLRKQRLQRGFTASFASQPSTPKVLNPMRPKGPIGRRSNLHGQRLAAVIVTARMLPTLHEPSSVPSTAAFVKLLARAYTLSALQLECKIQFTPYLIFESQEDDVAAGMLWQCPLRATDPPRQPQPHPLMVEVAAEGR